MDEGLGMKIKVLGTGCPKCKKLYSEVEKAIVASGVNADLERVEKMDEIIKYGVARLIESIFRACRLDMHMPDKLPAPDELQKIIEGQCSKYAR